ncbi:MAG: hypothetical protein Q4E70_02130 [Candidatus Saccharibacteria bacterium]|nr:hypothetical protein [Candidatus Saccharibacteria bacterium]
MEIKAKIAIDKIYTALINRGAVDRLTKALDDALDKKDSKKDVLFARITEEMLDEINAIRVLQDKRQLTKRNVKAFSGAINNHLTKHLKEYGSTRKIAKAAFEVLTDAGTLILPADTKRENKGSLLVKTNSNRFADSVVLNDTVGNETSLRDISPRSSRKIRSGLRGKEALLKQQKYHSDE